MKPPLEAWETIEKATPDKAKITPFGEASTGVANEQLIPDDSHERVIYARRLVSQRCIYGVDVNPLATEMAKLSLWLLTLAKDKPFTFLDHSVRCGDSLVGLSSLEELLSFSLDATISTGPLLEQQRQAIENRVNATTAQRTQIESLPSNTPDDVERKSQMLLRTEEQTSRLSYAADMLLACNWGEVTSKERVASSNANLLEASENLRSQDWTAEWFENEAKKVRDEAGIPSRFHWPLEFPEVFSNHGGFDAFVCNPPFMKGHFISRNFGDAYREYVVFAINQVPAGLADLVSFFFSRASTLLRRDGAYGFLATNSIADGDTNVVGLDRPAKHGIAVRRADRDKPWPGVAGVVISIVWAAKGSWGGKYVLDEREVKNISPQLNEGIREVVHQLNENKSTAFNGSYLLGDGYVVSDSDANDWISHDTRYENVILSYINGKELFTYPTVAPRRKAICFWDWTESQAAEYGEAYARLKQEVKPVRDKVNRDRRRKLWWVHAENNPGLYHALGRGSLFRKHPSTWDEGKTPPDVVICKAKTSKTWAFTFLPATTNSRDEYTPCIQG